MPKRSYGRKRYKPRKSQGQRKSEKQRKLLGGVIDTGLQYASSFPGPVGMVAKGLQYVKSVINVENNRKDTSITLNPSTQVNATGSDLNAIAQGDDIGARTGRSILANSVIVNYSLIKHASASQTFVRLVLVCDKKPDTGNANYGEIYGVGANYQSFIDRANGADDRFIILKSKTIALDANHTLESGKFKLSLKGVHVRYDGTAATDFETNRIMIVAISNESTNTPTVFIDSRFTYSDN